MGLRAKGRNQRKGAGGGTGYGGESGERGMNENGLFPHLIFCFILTMNLPHEP